MSKFGMVLVSSLLVPAVALAQPAAEKKKAEPPTAGAPATPPVMKAPPPPPPPAAPPEVKATVDAFKGNWRFEATLAATGMPGMEKPFTTKMSFNCKEVAGKTAVSCEAKAKSPMGPMEALYVIAYNPYDKAVHFTSFTNMFEVHDHACKWGGLTLTCTPLKAGMGPAGDELTEDVTISWGADKKCTAGDATCLPKSKSASFKSLSKMTKGGATMTFEGKGKR